MQLTNTPRNFYPRNYLCHITTKLESIQECYNSRKPPTKSEEIGQHSILEAYVLSCEYPSGQFCIKYGKTLKSPHNWIIQPVI